MRSYDLAGPDPNPMTKREIDALKSLCRELPRNPRILEIGAERGCSTLAMLEERPDAFIVSIDVGERPEQKENLQKAGLPWRRVIRILGRSQVVGLYWPWCFDLGYIDGDHRRPGIDEDIVLWAPKSTIIAFHDYIPPEKRGSHIHGRVWEAIQEWDKGEREQLLWVDRLIAFR